MKILITGNMGYIGPVVACHLRRTLPDCELIGYDIGIFGGCLVDPLQFPEPVLDRQHFGDIRACATSLFDGLDAVVHLAAISNEPIGEAFAPATRAINRIQL